MAVTLTVDDIEAIASAVAEKMRREVLPTAVHVEPEYTLPPNSFLPLEMAIIYFPVYNVPSDVAPAVVKSDYKIQVERLRVDIRNGEFRSGSEVQKKGHRWLVNPSAYQQRKIKEQIRKKVC